MLSADTTKKRIVFLSAFAFLGQFNGSTEDAQEPVYKENAASFRLRECGSGSMHRDTITHPSVFLHAKPLCLGNISPTDGFKAQK